jgi:hypothetical protein
MIPAAAITAVVAAMTGTLTAADPTGVWRSTTSFPSQAVQGTLRLWVDREGPILDGCYFYGANRRGLEINPVFFHEEQGEVHFAVEFTVNGQRSVLWHRGTINGNTIIGQCSLEIGNQRQVAAWVARRQN